MIQLVEGKANLTTVNNLRKYNHIDDVLGEHGAVILLYEMKPHNGHWVCLFRLNDNTLYFFDPYGLKPDEQLKFGKYSKPYLGQLLSNSGYNVKYNNKDIQRYCKSVSTCGKFVAFKLLFRNMPNNKFISLFLDNKHYDPDFWVSALMAFL